MGTIERSHPNPPTLQPSSRAVPPATVGLGEGRESARRGDPGELLALVDAIGTRPIKRPNQNYMRGRDTRQNTHCRILRRSEGLAPMALAAVSRLVVVAEDIFLNALFAPAGRDRLSMTSCGASTTIQIGVIVDEHSTGDSAIEALSRPDAATSSATSRRASRS